MMVRCGLVIFGVVAVTLAGCGPARPYVSEERLDRGWVLVFPGIDGRGWHNRAIRDGLADGGVVCAVEIVDWTVLGTWTALYNLRAEQRNRRKAGQIARRITAYQDAHPGRKVLIVAASGGAAVAVWTAEALDEDHPIEGIVLLAAALSPAYRLDEALARCRRGLVNFYSPLDWVLLGVGTTVAGTSDGRHRSAAGRVGFETPRFGGVNGAYGKLYQVGWRASMIRQGHLGGHLTSTTSALSARYVAPLIRAQKWDEQLIRDLADGGSR